MLYISLFPQLIAGPIVRYTEVEADILTRTESFDEFALGVKRFIYGLGKKVLIANFVAQISDNVFDGSVTPSVLMAWLGAIAYTMQIYFDFSGYSDMAIGLGKMFGFHFSENFNYPYIANSVTDFWRRWHISLSTWFRDYVYIPLGGNRVKESRWVLNLFAVWALTGIWHGANWTFLVWGFFYFTVLLIEKNCCFTKKIGFLSHIYTLAVVIIAWVFFRANDLISAVTYLGNMFGTNNNVFFDSGIVIYIKGTYIVLIIGVIGATPLFKKMIDKLNRTRFFWLEDIWLFIVFILSAIEIIGSTYNPFIYFNF